MNTSPASIVGILDRLSIGVSRTAIRHYATPTPFKPKKHHLTGFKPGHGEQIYVYNHIENGMIIYSHKAELKRDDDHALDQIPFTVKKQKPPVLRRDYWQPLCMIQFDQGQGMVGRSVFQKLREFRRLHELQWGWQAEELRKMNKQLRGAAIHNQKPNAVADIAAVLGGAGRGNLMWTTELEKQQPMVEEEEERLEVDENVARDKQAEESVIVQAVKKTGKEVKAAAPSLPETTQADAPAETLGSSEVILTATPAAPTSSEETTLAKAPKVGKKTRTKKVGPPAGPKRLLNATIYWANDVDLDWAKKWSPNVSHELGLPDGVMVANWKTKLMREKHDEEAKEEVKSEAKSGKKTDVETEQKQEAKPEQIQEQKQKSWLGSLNPWARKSSSEARV